MSVWGVSWALIDPVKEPMWRSIRHRVVKLQELLWFRSWQEGICGRFKRRNLLIFSAIKLSSWSLNQCWLFNFGLLICKNRLKFWLWFLLYVFNDLSRSGFFYDCLWSLNCWNFDYLPSFCRLFPDYMCQHVLLVFGLHLCPSSSSWFWSWSSNLTMMVFPTSLRIFASTSTGMLIRIMFSLSLYMSNIGVGFETILKGFPTAAAWFVPKVLIVTTAKRLFKHSISV